MRDSGRQWDVEGGKNEMDGELERFERFETLLRGCFAAAFRWWWSQAFKWVLDAKPDPAAAACT